MNPLVPLQKRWSEVDPPPLDEAEYGGAWAPEHAEAPPLRVISAADFDGVAPPERRWIIPDMIPDRTVSIVSGDGGDGKTTLMLQLCASKAAGRPWLGYSLEPGAAIFASAEDDIDELHRRTSSIAVSLGVGLADLVDLHLVPLAGHDAVMGAPHERAGIITATDIFRGLVALVKRIKPRLVVLDALADVFGGDEINRAQVRQFVGLLRSLAIDHNLAVVLIAHPSLEGMRNGSGSSGSTAWNNSVRARVYLERAKNEEDRKNDPDFRILSVKKSNYGPAGVEMRLRWRDGAFVLDGSGNGFDKLAASAKAERVFLDQLAAFTAQGRDVSDSPGANYAPTQFEKQGPDPQSKTDLKQAMQRLFSAKRIRVETFGPSSRRRKRIVLEPTKEREP